MLRLQRTPAVALLSALATVGVAAAASADTTAAGDGSHAVFVQTDGLRGNAVVAYSTDSDGQLSGGTSYPTGGLGGALTDAAVDYTASQGALTADRAHSELYAVNAGSDTLSVFDVDGTRLRLRQVVPTFGTFPVSVTVAKGVVYVLNARDGGSVQGYLNRHGRLIPIPAWHRDLGLDAPIATGEFVTTPGQVAFTPDGGHLVVTTKASGHSILTFGVGPAGQISPAPVVQPVSGAVPFGVAFDSAGRLQVAEAGSNAVSTWRVGADGHLTLLGRTDTGAQATCWVAASDDLLAVSNAASSTVTSFRATPADPALLSAAATDTGTVDASFAPDGQHLYVQTGLDGDVDTFSVGDNGTLTKQGSVLVRDAAGGEGIVAW